MQSLDDIAQRLCDIGRGFHARGWALGTSGNYSAVSSAEPLRLAITRSGLDKGRLLPRHVLVIDQHGAVLAGEGRPSDETVVHLAIVRARAAGAVLHTHSVWNTVLSERCASAGGLRLAGFEMLKGLAGVSTHTHEEWLPLLANTQDYERLALDVEQALAQHPAAHGLLLRGHGLYTWGRDLAEAQRHVEVLEFLFEVVGRLHDAGRSAQGAPHGHG